VLKNASLKIADALPENNYWAFSAYTMLLPLIFKEVLHQVTLPQWALSGPVWNYADGVSSGIVGTIQILDNETHRQKATKVKGVFNILNGIQLTVLTKISFAAFGGPAFAAAFGVGFLLSLDETARSVRRYCSLEYWFKDSLAQYKKITDELLPNLQDEIDELKQKKRSNGDTLNTIEQWALNSKIKRIDALQSKKNELEQALTNRYLNNPDNDSISKVISSFCDLQNPNTSEFIKNLESVQIKGNASSKTEAQFKKEMKAEITNCLKDNVIWGLAFAGMLLICFPPTHLIGLVIVGVASGLYLAKNAHKLGQAATAIASSLGFFKPSEGKNKQVTAEQNNHAEETQTGSTPAI
jgi:hypothetical protein